MTRQEEADEIIKFYEKRNGCSIAVKDYYDKYLKPKDQLFEKLEQVLYETALTKSGVESSIGIAYQKFKEIFSEELNGTKGLQEAIEKKESLSLQPNSKYWVSVEDLQEIKEKLES